MTPEQTSDLLSHRDGERLDPAIAQRIEADPASRAELTVLRQLKHELNELPSVPPPGDAWTNIQARVAKKPKGFGAFTINFPLATAATVFLAAAISIALLDPAGLYDNGTAESPVVADSGISIPAGAPQANSFAGLIDRSQRLESQLLYANNQVGWDNSQQALLYRIADVDAELSRFADGELTDPAAREELWRQRVELLESLAQSRRANAVIRPAVY